MTLETTGPTAIKGLLQAKHRVIMELRDIAMQVGDKVTHSRPLSQLVGEDPAFVALKQKLPLVARHGAPVLLTGETGTGKELCARAIHYLSQRADRPFIPINCGAIPAELFESELFGHEKGAFTGAWKAQPGLVDEAKEGSLFLDEIENLSLAAQVKLLRFIENGSYHSLGSAKVRHADVRIIAATNLDLREKIHQRLFREDLFYRLAVMDLHLPPLRQRQDDIPLLVSHFWTHYGNGEEGGGRQLSVRALEAMCQYAWPGNIRELENVVQQLLVLSSVEVIEPDDLPIPRAAAPSTARKLSFNQARAEIIEQFEKNYVSDLLRTNGGNVSRAAKAAQKERRSFGRLIKKYQLEKR